MKHCIALLSLGFVGMTFAQEPLPPFEEVDANQDGRISRTEAAAIEGLDFSTADENQDGLVDRNEYLAVSEGQPGEPGQPGQPGEPGQQGQD